MTEAGRAMSLGRVRRRRFDGEFLGYRAGKNVPPVAPIYVNVGGGRNRPEVGQTTPVILP